MNDYVGLGNLTKDVAVSKFDKKDGSQGAVAHFTLAINNGSNAADYIRVSVFGKQAENLAKYNHQGDKVLVQGSLRQNTYTDKSGIKRYQLEVSARNIQYIEKAKRNQATAA